MKLQENMPRKRRKRGEMLAECGGDAKVLRRLRYQTWKNNDPERYRELVRKYNRAPASRLGSLKSAAKKRRLEFSISKEFYDNLLTKSCHYCQGSLNNTGSSMDRIDNNIGYLESNVLPCCTACNRIRGEFLTVDETQAVIKFLKEYRQARGIN